MLTRFSLLDDWQEQKILCFPLFLFLTSLIPEAVDVGTKVYLWPIDECGTSIFLLTSFKSLSGICLSTIVEFPVNWVVSTRGAPLRRMLPCVWFREVEWVGSNLVF